MKQFVYPNSQFITITGAPSVGWKMNVYDTGTSNLASIFSDAAMTVLADNPVIADAEGFFDTFFWSGTIDVVVTDENDGIQDSVPSIKDLTTEVLEILATSSTSIPSGIATGTGDAISLTLPVTADFDDLAIFLMRANAANTGALNTPNLQVNAFASRRIKKIGGEALLANDIRADQNCILVYNQSDDDYYLINHEASFLRRDGSLAMLGALDGGGFKVVNIASGAARADVPNIGQIQDHGTTYSAVGGTADALTFTLSPAPVAYVTGMQWTATATGDNTGPATGNLNAIGVKAIKRPEGADLFADDILTGQEYEFFYDGTNIVLLNPSGVITQPVNDSSNKPASTEFVQNKTSSAADVRQTVLSSSVDANGFANYISIGTGLAVDIAVSPRVVIAAAFLDANRVGYITAATSIGSLATNSTNYLYADVNSDATVTLGSTTLAPVYQWGGAYSTTANQVTFNIQEMTAKVGNGATASQVWRVFLGEAVTNLTNVTSVVNYALMGRYLSVLATPLTATNTRTTFSHNIGCNLIHETGIVLECLTAELGYVVGERVFHAITETTGGTTFKHQITHTRNEAKVKTGATTAWELLSISAPEQITSLTAANWSYGIIIKRAF